MDSERECTVCYRTFKAGPSCPPELHCKQSFSERCRRALSRPLGAQRPTVCPLCRHTTSISGEGVTVELTVDESVLQPLMVSEAEEEEKKEEGAVGPVQATLPETPAKGGVPSPASTGERPRQGGRSFWRVISEKRQEPTPPETPAMERSDPLPRPFTRREIIDWEDTYVKGESTAPCGSKLFKLKPMLVVH
ncbi:rnf227 [Pungitius sinensis]